MDSSSQELLEALRSLDYDSNSDSNVYFSDMLSDDFESIDKSMSNQWREVEGFFKKVLFATNENLRIVRSELEAFSESSYNIEEHLLEVVHEVCDTVEELLKELNLNL